MNDNQRIVDDIRSFLASPDQTLTDEVKETAQAYVSACREANQRLRRCAEFLDKGLRSEAIQFAQTEPVLLDVVSLLDLEERSEWQNISASYGLPAAPQLLLNAAEQLNRAYTEEQPLQHLLEQHRFLALVRAPVGQRLQVLHRMAAVDAGNPVWGEDAAAFERARWEELSVEIDQALARVDSGHVASIWKEINREGWRTQPPTDLCTKVVRARVADVADEIAAAFREQDFARLGELRGRWDELRRLQPVPPLAQKTADAFGWLTKQERLRQRQAEHQEAVVALERALVEGAGAEQLEKLYQEASRHPSGVPDLVKRQYHLTISTIRGKAQRREAMIITLTFVVGLGLLIALLRLVR